MLQSLCNRLYPAFSHSLGIFSRFDKFMYDDTQYKKYGEHPYSFVGKMLCGESCFILKYLLEKEGCDVKVYRNQEQKNGYIDDHVFLEVDETEIIDPTYRQFMVDKCDRKKLFEDTPPILSTNDIESSVKELVGEEKYTDVKKRWQQTDDVSEKFNLHEFANDITKLIGKPDYYQKLVKNLR